MSTQAHLDNYENPKQFGVFVTSNTTQPKTNDLETWKMPPPGLEKGEKIYQPKNRHKILGGSKSFIFCWGFQ